MIFFSVLIALITEQMRALPLNNPVTLLLQRHIAAVERFFTSTVSVDIHADGSAKWTWQSVLAWLAIVLPWVVGVSFLYMVLHHSHFILAFAWSTAVVYFTLGFRQFSHPFTAIRLALRQEDLTQAQILLQEWTGLNTTDMSLEEVLRHTMVQGVLAVQRRVFGVFFWLIIPVFIPFGPIGAVLYRIADHLAYSRNGTSPMLLRNPAFEAFCRQVFFVLNWIPARLTAFGFGIVGNFEEAMHAWRNEGRLWPDSNEGSVLAAAGGAIGIRLLPAVMAEAKESDESVNTPDIAFAPQILDVATGLVWRATVLWMALLLMLTFTAWVG